MQKTDSALWAGLGGILLCGGVYLLLRESQSDGLRVVLTLAALLAPLGASARRDWRGWLGDLPEPLLILLSGAAGLAIWSVSWWLMDMGNEQLFELVGQYRPDFFSLEAWWAQVIYTVVLLPLAGSLLIFGLMRRALSQIAPLPQAALLVLYFAVLNVLNTPQGLVGLLGYGLLGAVAAFLVLRTRSFWAGLAAYGSFMYANLSLVDNLAFEMGGVDYFDTRWLALVLFSGFITLVLTQIVRFRTPPPEGARQTISPTGWAALVGVLLILLLYAASEIDQRNTLGREASGVTGYEAAEL